MQPARGVEGLPELALRRGAVAQRHVRQLVAVGVASGEVGSPADVARGLRAADRGQALAARARRLADDVERPRAPVARHLPAPRRGIVGGADGLQQHLVRRDAQRERERAVAVVREEPVVPGAEVARRGRAAALRGRRPRSGRTRGSAAGARSRDRRGCATPARAAGRRPPRSACRRCRCARPSACREPFCRAPLPMLRRTLAPDDPVARDRRVRRRRAAVAPTTAPRRGRLPVARGATRAHGGRADRRRGGAVQHRAAPGRAGAARIEAGRRARTHGGRSRLLTDRGGAGRRRADRAAVRRPCGHRRAPRVPVSQRDG